MKGEAITDDVNCFLPVTIEKVSSEGEYIGLLFMSDILEWKERSGQSIQNRQIRSLLEKDEEDNPVAVFVK
jgi:hypothetical protein